MFEADLRWTRLNGANLTRSSFYGADLSGSDLSGAQMFRSDLRWANLSESVIADANMTDTDLYHADLHSARLRDVDLTQARLDLATLADGEITRCQIYGISAWDVKLENTVQSELIITQPGEPTIAIDDLDAAQFINLLLHSSVLRDRVADVAAKLALVLTARVPGSDERIARIGEALSKAGWVCVHYDVGAVDGEQMPAMLRAMLRFCGAVITDLEDIAPFGNILTDSAAEIGRRILPVVRTADVDPDALIDPQRHDGIMVPARSYAQIEDLVDDLPAL